MTDQINPDGPLATSIYSLFRFMRDFQRDQQDAIGFGEEGHALRRQVELWEEALSHEEEEEGAERTARGLDAARGALRNYYITKLALITTEVAEAIEEIRNGHAMDETYYPSKGSTDSPFEKSNTFGPFKPEGVPSELADVVIRVWSLIGEVGLDLGPIIVEKLNYNATRAQRHGGKAI